MAPAEEAIRAKARESGFDAVGLAAAGAAPDAGRHLAAFLAAGHHGDMAWMARHAARRADPGALWPEARSLIALGVSYAPAGDPLARLARPDVGAVSVYARGRDYHAVLKKRLKALGRWMAAEFDCAARVFVDTAPLMEKPAAARAGLGWQGKHTNLVSRRFGSWLFLGEILTTLELAADAPHADRCGSCQRCLRACPTDALAEPYQLRAERCLSYLTIEHKGAIPEDLRSAMGNRVYGCDDCLAACPWNRFAPAAEEPAFAEPGGSEAPQLEALAGLDDAAFRRRFAGSPIKRTGRDRFVRNVLVAIGNGADAAHAGMVRRLARDASPLVRDAAAWALARLEATEDGDAGA